MLVYITKLVYGLPISLIFTFSALLIAFCLSLCLTTLLTLQLPLPVFQLIKGYILVFTGTPLLIQIFLIYYGPGQFIWLKQITWLWDFFSKPWLCALLALSLNSTAYTTQLLYGAVRAIPHGYWQACDALGMSRTQTLFIMLPYALKRAISAYSNEVILVFKSTSLIYTITLMDIMGYAQQIYGQTYDMNVFISAGIIYLIINGILALIMRLLEKWALSFEADP